MTTDTTTTETDALQSDESLTATVKFYERHLIVCTGNENWSAKIEAGGGFVQSLAEQIATESINFARPVKLTACDAPSTSSSRQVPQSRQLDEVARTPVRPVPSTGRGDEGGWDGVGYDVLVFPDMLRYISLTAEDIPALITDHLLGRKVANQLSHEQLTGQHIFVCTHTERDVRCGECGPPLFERFQHEVASLGLDERVNLYRSSHVGGHRFAGNVLVYPPGDWYGYVTPHDVSRILAALNDSGDLPLGLWRGRMGLTPEEQNDYFKHIGEN